jgi:phosphosulfolactate synthase
MKTTSHETWTKGLIDPSKGRDQKPRRHGRTMIMDKGLGVHAFQDLLETSGDFVDMIKLGFGTASLYTPNILKQKIEMAACHDVCIYPGGTFLEIAVSINEVDAFFEGVKMAGFTAIEVSEGTIDLNRRMRTELIERGIDAGLRVITEYGKKSWGSMINVDLFMEMFLTDLEAGAEMVIVEARESGLGVGLFDENGRCRDRELTQILHSVKDLSLIMWEAPLKDQQIHLIKQIGPQVNRGNIAPSDLFTLEAMRRGLRSDTFALGKQLQLERGGSEASCISTSSLV